MSKPQDVLRRVCRYGESSQKTRQQGYGPPDPETTVTSYFVHGSSKYGAFTDTDCVESELIEKSLALGEWTVYAIGNNASGESVASSVSMIVNLVPNEIITIELLCMPV